MAKGSRLMAKKQGAQGGRLQVVSCRAQVVSSGGRYEPSGYAVTVQGKMYY